MLINFSQYNVAINILEYVFCISLRYLGVELQARSIFIFSYLLGMTKLLSKVDVQILIPTSSVNSYVFSHSCLHLVLADIFICGNLM